MCYQVIKVNDGVISKEKKKSAKYYKYLHEK